MTAERPDRALVNSIFGPELSVSWSVDRDPDPSGDAGDAGERDRWLRENVPPHHI
jgi:hypothetical protein